MGRQVLTFMVQDFRNLFVNCPNFPITKEFSNSVWTWVEGDLLCLGLSQPPPTIWSPFRYCKESPPFLECAALLSIPLRAHADQDPRSRECCIASLRARGEPGPEQFCWPRVICSWGRAFPELGQGTVGSPRLLMPLLSRWHAPFLGWEDGFCFTKTPFNFDWLCSLL